MIRRLFKCLIFISIVFSLLCLGAWAYLNSDYAKPQIAQAIGKSLSKFAGSDVSIGGISFSFPNTLTLTDIALSEATTPWMTARDLRVSVSTPEILKGKIIITSLELDDVNLISLPSVHSESHSFSLASLNLNTSLPVALEQIKINHATVSPSITSRVNLFPEHFSKGLQFYAAIFPDFSHGSISSTFLLGPIGDAKESLSKIETSLKQQENNIEVSFNVNDGKTGLVSELIGRPLPDSLHLQGHAISSLDDLQSLLETIPDGAANKLNGSFLVNVGKHIQGQGHISIFSDRSLCLSIDKANYGPIDVQGKVFLSPKLTFDNTELNISSDNIALLDRWLPLPAAISRFNASCHLSGDLDTLHALINFKADEVNYEAIHAKKMIGNLEIDRHIDLWEGQLHLATSLEDIPIEASTHFNWKPGNFLSLADLSLTGNSAMAQGTLTYEQDSGWLEADLKGIANLSSWNRWFPEAVDGEVAFAARWLHSPTPSVEIQIEAPKLAYKDILLKDVALVASFSDLFSPSTNHLQGKIYSSIGQLVDKDIILHSLTMATTINGQEENWPVILSIGESSTDVASIDAEGTWSLQEKMFNLSINQLQGKISDASMALQQPIMLQLTPSSFELTPLQFSLGNGILKASMDYRDSLLLSSFQFENIPLNLLSLNSLTLPVQGLVSGLATMKGPLDSPKIECQLQFKDVRINEFDFAHAPAFSGTFKINLDENGLKYMGNAAPSDHPPFHLEAHLPIAFSLYPLALNIDKQAPVSGNAQISGEIQTILQLFFTDSINLSGPINATVSLTGTMESPLVNGTATISDGSFEILDTGAVLRNVSAYFESSGKTIILKNLSASDKYGGTLLGSGELLLDYTNQFPYHIDFDIHNSALLDLDFAKGAFTGNLTLKGNMAGATLGGSAVANSATITIPEQTTALLNSIDVTYINQPENETVPVIDKSPPWPFMLDINVSAPDSVSVRGKDLTSEWKGNLTIKGPATNLVFLGNFKVIGGKYLFNGKDFDINQGSISLNGILDNKSTTTLYVIASKDLGKVKVEVIIKGPVTTPEISFRSNPPLPQREILSWILFNRGTSEISPFQGTQLTESITNLKSNQKGPDVLTKIRNSLGIDRIDISRDENNGNAVNIQVGKYISQNVFVSVNKSDVNRIAVEATLMPNIKLQAQVGDDSEGQILLKWKHDY